MSWTLDSRCLVTELQDGTAVLLHLDTKFYYTLNRTGFAVWKALPQATDLDDVARALSREFEVLEPTARRDAETIVKQLQQERLIRESP